MLTPVAVFSLAFLSLLVRGERVFQNLKLSAQNIAPDGFPRSASVANGQFPAPLITATKGDVIMVAVNNELSDPTMKRSTSIVRFQPITIVV